MASLAAGKTELARTLGRDRGLAPLVAVAAPVALLVLGLVAFAPGLVTQDFWLALVSGREIAQHGLPHVDHLTVMAGGRRWVDQQWLAQLLLYEAARLGGVGTAAAVCLLAIAAALWFAGLTAHRRGGSPLVILCFLVVAIAASPWGMQLRSQALALPLFSLTLFLLARDPDARRWSTLWVLPALCLWSNLHGSAVLGALLVMIWGLQALVRTAEPEARVRGLACLLLAPAALLASPYAASLPGYYRLMLVDPPFGTEIREWNRTTPSALTAVFFALVVVCVALVAARKRRLTPFDALVLALTLATGLEAIRGIVWFGFACAAILPALATREPGSTRFEGSAAGALASLAVLICGGAIAWAAAQPASHYTRRFPPALLAVVRAKTTADGARVLADDASADWLLWELPSLRGRVAYDVRFELLTRPQIARLVAWDRLAPGWQAATAGYSLVVADPRHVAALLQSGRWRRVFTSSSMDVAVPIAGPQPARS